MTKPKPRKGVGKPRLPKLARAIKPPPEAVTDVLTRMQSRIESLANQLETFRRNLRQSNADRRQLGEKVTARIQRLEEQLGIAARGDVQPAANDGEATETPEVEAAEA